MEKRHQVFVSSTYVDLKDERQSVLQTLMEMDCIPAGMELFPAADEEQWEFIKKVIDDCDYYLLIIGGRYGSTAEDGLSYTEKEFDYAVSKGIKVVALLHETPDSLPRAKSEISEEQFAKLQKFRKKVENGRLVRFWNDSVQIPGLVALSLNKTIKMYPAVGWVRADSAASPELLAELNELHRRNEALQEIISTNVADKPFVSNEELADWDSVIELKGSYKMYARNMNHATEKYAWSASVTWAQLFSSIAPLLADKASDSNLNRFAAKQFSNVDASKSQLTNLEVDSQVLYTVRIQLLALGLISINNDVSEAVWSLTDLGFQEMMKARVVTK